MTNFHFNGVVFFETLSENGVPQRQAIGTFDVCLARPKGGPTVRSHVAQVIIDSTCRSFLPNVNKKYGLVRIDD